MEREQMLEMLREGVCEVQFEKKDGTMRTMKCTINQTYIPKDLMPKTGVDYNSATIRAFEVPEKQWRSFRVDSVKNFEKV